MTFFIGIRKKFFLSWTINSVVVSNVWNICLHAFSYLTLCFSMWNVLYLFLSSIFFPFQLCGYVPSFSLNVPYFMVPTPPKCSIFKAAENRANNWIQFSQFRPMPRPIVCSIRSFQFMPSTFHFIIVFRCLHLLFCVILKFSCPLILIFDVSKSLSLWISLIKSGWCNPDYFILTLWNKHQYAWSVVSQTFLQVRILW